MKPHLKVETHPLAIKENILQGEKYRITVLTESLIRLEYSADGCFTDEATQMVWNRDFPAVSFSLREEESELEIRTRCLQVQYNKQDFSANGLSIRVISGDLPSTEAWHYGDKIKELGGTARTLDGVNGACRLEPGILSWFGYSVLDDSASLILTEDGWVAPRKKGGKDLYFFGYGWNFRQALKDFYHLCGKTPMLPRFALGNWWSRYWKYTEDSYLELMDRFEKEQVPFTVAVIDMDWHLVDIDPKYGSGWTGYTWNREFFPDPERFLKNLHDRGMKTTLNVHPADGIRAYEDCYPKVALDMGVDVEKEEPVNFDIADQKFLETYLEDVHHPLEEEGVDFWWIDWQQGTSTKMEGLDPLWMLNHYHFLDSGRNGKRPMTFSRYAGPGSHRYPVGFSGDTYITWDSLSFQPYFTSTASNIGYGWWSHDIGGHMLGYRDEEMEARWYQFGVFSPINRLHSSNSAFSGKEPWNFRTEVRMVMDDFLRLRHRLIPYLYTMNYRAWNEDQPLLVPMYYDYPETLVHNHNLVPNQYLFGTELMVTPVTTKRLEGIGRAKTKVYLPEGVWFDFFTGTVYQGKKTMNLYRTLESIPVLAKGGAIVPMTERISARDAASNPDELTIRVYAGADHSFDLYEDDNVSCDYQNGICAITPMQLFWSDKKAFVVKPVKGHVELIPEKREYRIEIVGSTARSAEVLVNGKPVPAVIRAEDGILTAAAENIGPEDLLEIVLPKDTGIKENDRVGSVMKLLREAEISYPQKEELATLMERADGNVSMITAELLSMDLSEDLRGAILEFITA